MIAAEFARFIGIPVTRQANITDIIEAVCGVCTDTKVTTVCVEIRNLNIATRTRAEASDTVKYFSERIPATFVLAGINVERTGLLSGPRGEQIAGRYSIVRTGPFPPATPSGPPWPPRSRAACGCTATIQGPSRAWPATITSEPAG